MIEQTKTKPQETLEFKMIRSKQTFSFNPPINLVEEGKWLLGVSLLGCTKSVFNITNENNSFSITIPGRWESNLTERTVYKLNKMLDLKTQNNIDLHVQDVRRRGHQTETGDKEYKLSDFDIFKEKLFEELKLAEYNDLEDMVYRFQLTYDKTINILDL